MISFSHARRLIEHGPDTGWETDGYACMQAALLRPAHSTLCHHAVGCRLSEHQQANSYQRSMGADDFDASPLIFFYMMKLRRRNILRLGKALQ